MSTKPASVILSDCNLNLGAAFTKLVKYMCKSAIQVSCIRSMLFVGVAFFGISLPAIAQDYYVRSGATGYNNGSDWNNAYTSLPSTKHRGATYYVADGSYGSHKFDTGASGSTLITIKKATANDHGTDTGWDDTYGDGQANFASPLQFTTPYWLFDGVVWEGFVLASNNTAGPCASCGTMYISSSGDFVTIKGVKFNGNYNGSFGHTVGLAGKDTTFEYCHFYKTSNEDHFGGWPEGTLTIRRSVITMPNPPNDGAHRDVFNPESSGGWNLVFDKNIVYDIWLFGFLLQDSGGIGTMTITNNVFSNFGGPVFRNGSGSGGNDSAIMYNNVFHNCINQEGLQNTTEKNNVFIHTGNWAYWGNDDIHYSANASQYNLWETGTSAFQSGTGNISGKANFINTASPLGADGIPFTADDGFNIKAGSAAIGAGVNVGLTTDIRGNPVPSKPSIGAYEFNTSSGSEPPVVEDPPASQNPVTPPTPGNLRIEG